jgi:hypothetical protein
MRRNEVHQCHDLQFFDANRWSETVADVQKDEGARVRRNSRIFITIDRRQSMSGVVMRLRFSAVMGCVT